MSVGAFYGSLATSASVFIGISSVYLVNKISNTDERRRQIKNGIEETEQQLEQAKARKEKYKTRAEEIEEKWQDRQIKSWHSDIEDFIDNHITKNEFSIPPEVASWSEIVEEAEDYFGFDDDEEFNDDFLDVLRSRRDEIESELATAAANKFVPNNTTQSTSALQMGIRESFDEVKGSFKEEYDIENIRATTQEALKNAYNKENKPSFMRDAGFNLNPDVSNQTININKPGERTVHSHNKLHETKASTRIETLENRLESLKNEKSAIESEVLTRILLANVIAILLCVIVPLTAYLIALGGWPRLSILPPFVDTVIVFLAWLGGLYHVLSQMKLEIQKLTP